MVCLTCPAGAFLALAVLFFKDAGGADAPHSSSMVANALQQLQTNRGLRAILMIVGILLITYGESGTPGRDGCCLWFHVVTQQKLRAPEADRQCSR